MKAICILLIDHESISEKIILKSLKNILNSNINKIYFIGDKEKFNKIYCVTKKYKKLKFINIENNKSNNFLFIKKTTKEALKLFKNKKIKFLINMPIDKKKYLKNKFVGYTEFYSSIFGGPKIENMLMYNDTFSTCPITTHIELKKVDKCITKKKIINTVKNISNFYKKLNKKIEIVYLGLNPHAGIDFDKNCKEYKVIIPTLKFLKKKNYPVIGPVSADTAFIKRKNKVFIGNYHDQALIPFKLLNKFNGINITIGKKLIRISPDHGTGKKLKKNNHISNESFINCIKFCERY